jgi:hypothetical protein
MGCPSERGRQNGEADATDAGSGDVHDRQRVAGGNSVAGRRHRRREQAERRCREGKGKGHRRYFYRLAVHDPAQRHRRGESGDRQRHLEPDGERDRRQGARERRIARARNGIRLASASDQTSRASCAL